ncbi:MAG TPA: hypothetical protein VJN18_11365 [Polyangiaceae bacterium]|nr:hypothetical protein [Polyangiaceae bacterium]
MEPADCQNVHSAPRVARLVGLVGLLLGCGATEKSPPAPQEVPPPPTSPDRYWLNTVGWGQAQNERLCARGYGDFVARQLCDPAVAKPRSLEELYDVLQLPREPPFGTLALGASSSGLSFRTVSTLVPRLFRMTFVEGLPDPAHFLVTAFARGEQQVELLAYDAAQNRIALYLLAFEQACNAERCTPDDLLTERVERDWLGFTLYEADDLKDTPLDCLSCHAPEGPTGSRTMLMRDMPSPWFHWFTEERAYCGDDVPPLHQLPDLHDGFERAHAGELRYGALDHPALRFSSGHHLQAAVTLFPDYSTGARLGSSEPFIMPSYNVVDEWTCQGSTAAWQQYRSAVLLARGFPIPEYHLDRLDPVLGAAATQGFSAWLQTRSADDPFDVAAGLIPEDIQRAVGARPDADMTAEAMLKMMCSRCHDQHVPEGSGRSLFRFDAITSESAKRAMARLQLPADSPEIMPPRRSGSLSPTDIALLTQHLALIAGPKQP